MQKVVILRGAPATGKTTALHNLRKRKEMKNWVVIDFQQLKKQFEHLGEEKRRLYGKQALFSTLKILMSQKLNILFDEMYGGAIKRELKYYLKKYNYKIIPLEFTSDIKTAISREAERRLKKGLKPRGEKWVKQTHKERLELFEKNSIMIDTTNMNQKQVVNFIIRKIL